MLKKVFKRNLPILLVAIGIFLGAIALGLVLWFQVKSYFDMINLKNIEEKIINSTAGLELLDVIGDFFSFGTLNGKANYAMGQPLVIGLMIAFIFTVIFDVAYLIIGCKNFYPMAIVIFVLNLISFAGGAFAYCLNYFNFGDASKQLVFTIVSIAYIFIVLSFTTFDFGLILNTDFDPTPTNFDYEKVEEMNSYIMNMKSEEYSYRQGPNFLNFQSKRGRR